MLIIKILIAFMAKSIKKLVGQLDMEFSINLHQLASFMRASSTLLVKKRAIVGCMLSEIATLQMESSRRREGITIRENLRLTNFMAKEDTNGRKEIATKEITMKASSRVLELIKPLLIQMIRRNQFIWEHLKKD